MNTCKPKNVVRLCHYIQDRRDGDFIESRNWKVDYLGFERISQSELDNLCLLAYSYLLEDGEDIMNSMGEIIFTQGLSGVDEQD